MRQKTLLIRGAALCGLLSTLNTAHAQGTAFTYQGRLNDNTNPANGIYDVRFAVYDAASLGMQRGNFITNSAIAVNNGLFTAVLDFGSQFPGADRWLEIGVRTNGAGTFTTLNPRQKLAATPYAITAGNVTGSVAASQLTGTLPLTQLPGSVVTNNGTTVNLNGTFTGNAGGLTNLQLSALGPTGTFSLGSGFYYGPPSYFPVAAYVTSEAVADVNGDGLPDVIAVNSTSAGTLVVLTNNGHGGFGANATYPVGANPNFVLATNLTSNGRTDLVSANYGDNTMTVLTNNGSGGFSLSATLGTGGHPATITAADVNGDGKLDLICADYSDGTLMVFTNNGSGSFSTNTILNEIPGSYSVTTADLNSDGLPDLICANFNNHFLAVLTNNGTGGFGSNATINVGFEPYCVVAADLNGDGKLDLVTANYGDSTLTVLTNDGSGGFPSSLTLRVGANPYCVAVADINGDGKPDLISADYSDRTLTVLVNNGRGGFNFYTKLFESGNPDVVAAADFNGDGQPDLVAAGFGNGSLAAWLTQARPVLSVNGGINSSIWKVTSVINATGALPVSGTFSSGGGTLLISVSGSGFSSTAAQTIGMDIQLDGATIDSSLLYANPANTHLAFVPATLKSASNPGTHTITLIPRGGTITDFNDYFRVLVQELPF